MVRILTTKNSVWTIDEKSKQFRRDPRREGGEHPSIDYVGEWISYDYLDEFSEGYVFFFFDTMHPQYGPYIRTGRIVDEERVMEHSMKLSSSYHSYAYDCYMVECKCVCGEIIKGCIHPTDGITEKWEKHKNES